jgi:hypothetical protein
VHGEMCPGEWVYHRFQLNDTSLTTSTLDSSNFNARVHLWKYVGDLYAMILPEAPIKLQAPYSYLAQSAHERTFDYCDVQRGDQVWVGLLGGSTCSVYDMTIHAYNGECQRKKGNNVASLFASATEVASGVQTPASCESHSFVDFYLQLGTGESDVHFSKDNVVFKVTMHPESQGDPHALALYLHMGGTLPDRRDDTEYFSKTATDGVLTIPVPRDGDAGVNRLFVSVECGPTPVRFQIAPVLMRSQLESNHHQYGEVCASDWVRHAFHALYICVASLSPHLIYSCNPGLL